MDELKRTFIDYCRLRGVRFESIDPDRISLGFTGDKAVYPGRVSFYPKVSLVLYEAVYPFRILSPKYADISKLISKINIYCLCGNFILEPTSGMVIFRTQTYVLCQDGDNVQIYDLLIQGCIEILEHFFTTFAQAVCGGMDVNKYCQASGESVTETEKSDLPEEPFSGFPDNFKNN